MFHPWRCLALHSRKSVKWLGNSLSHQLYKKVKWTNGRWCVEHFLPFLLQHHSKITGRGAIVQISSACPSISSSQCLNQTHTQRKREGRWLTVGWILPKAGMMLGARWEVKPLKQGAGAFWGWRGRVCRAVTHGQYVVVA